MKHNNLIIGLMAVTVVVFVPATLFWLKARQPAAVLHKAGQLFTSTNKDDLQLGLATFMYHGSRDDLPKVLPFLDHSDQNIQIMALQTVERITDIKSTDYL